MRLLHCPFCGEEAVTLRSSFAYRAYKATVSCPCGVTGAFGTSMISAEIARNAAISNWNARVSVPEDAALRVKFELLT